jgi:hypothetical protein
MCHHPLIRQILFCCMQGIFYFGEEEKNVEYKSILYRYTLCEKQYKTASIVTDCSQNLFVYFSGGLECASYSFAYIARFVFF